MTNRDNLYVTDRHATHLPLYKLVEILDEIPGTVLGIGLISGHADFRSLDPPPLETVREAVQQYALDRLHANAGFVFSDEELQLSMLRFREKQAVQSFVEDLRPMVEEILKRGLIPVIISCRCCHLELKRQAADYLGVELISYGDPDGAADVLARLGLSSSEYAPIGAG